MSILDDLFQQVDEGKAGAFSGYVMLEWHGPLEYQFLQQIERPFLFIRPNGEKIFPGNMTTDGGSIPRVLWNLPGLSPWDYLPAYIIHDYLFTMHEKRSGVPCSFDEANLILAEGLIVLGCPRYRIALIYDAVAADGRSHWDAVR